MILDNGVVRTLDPSLAVARALAIAGGRIAGGVGTHESARAAGPSWISAALRASGLHRLARALRDPGRLHRRRCGWKHRTIQEAVERVRAAAAGEARRLAARPRLAERRLGAVSRKADEAGARRNRA